MRTDTEALHGFALRVQALRSAWCPDPRYARQHGQIQDSLERLQAWLQQTAASAESAEAVLAGAASFWKPGQLSVNHSETWNLGKQLSRQKANTTLAGFVSASWRTARIVDAGQHHSFVTHLDAIQLSASGRAQVRFWKDRKFDPALNISASASLNALSGSGTYRIYGTGAGASASATLRLKGEAGALYARAEGVLSADGQSLDLAVGAAALRGECSLAFSLFGCTVTVTGEGSVGSAEASLSYRHKNREWEFGSKLGFIAGAGFKIHVSY